MDSGAQKNSTESSVVQVFFLKNREQKFDGEAYSKIQTVVIKDSFYGILGDRLKNYPQVVLKTPLISLQFYAQALERETKIFNIGDLSKIQITELKIAREGILFCMIIPTNAAHKAKMMGLHVKYGIDPDNAPAVWKRTILLNNPKEIQYMNIANLPFIGTELSTKYTFFYFATDKRIDEYSEASEVKSIDFVIYKVLAVVAYSPLLSPIFAVVLAMLLFFF